MKPAFLLVVLLIGTAFASDTPDREQQIRKRALEFWLLERGLLAEERIEITREFSAPRAIVGFAETGDRIVEIHILHISGAPSGILWLHEKSGAIQSLGLNQK